MTSPGSDIGDVEESYQRKRIWQWQFCTGSQKIILSKFDKEEIIRAYGEDGLLDIYPFVQWADEEDLFTNYTYITKVPIDFRTSRTANVVFEEDQGIAHGLILPYDEDEVFEHEHHRSLSYINTDNETHELFIGMFAHIDLMKDCTYLNNEYTEKILKIRYNMTMPITTKSLNCLYWNISSQEWGGQGCIVSTMCFNWE